MLWEEQIRTHRWYENKSFCDRFHRQWHNASAESCTILKHVSFLSRYLTILMSDGLRKFNVYNLDLKYNKTQKFLGQWEPWHWRKRKRVIYNKVTKVLILPSSCRMLLLEDRKFTVRTFMFLLSMFWEILALFKSIFFVFLTEIYDSQAIFLMSFYRVLYLRSR